MPLFIFDHDCMDRSVTYAYAVRRCCCDSAPVVVMGCFCWPWLGAMGGARATWVTAIGATWVGTRGKMKP